MKMLHNILIENKQTNVYSTYTLYTLLECKCSSVSSATSLLHDFSATTILK